MENNVIVTKWFSLQKIQVFNRIASFLGTLLCFVADSSSLNESRYKKNSPAEL